MKISLVEFALFEFLFLSVLWLINDFTGTLFSLAIAGISLFVLIFALVAEGIERSKVPKWYFKIMVISIIIPLLVILIFFLIQGGELSWLKDPFTQ